MNRAEGDAARFRQLNEAYQKAPEVTRRRLYLESMGRVLTRVGGKVVVDRYAKSVIPLLPLDSLKRVLPDSAAVAKKGGAQ